MSGTTSSCGGDMMATPLVSQNRKKKGKKMALHIVIWGAGGVAGLQRS